MKPQPPRNEIDILFQLFEQKKLDTVIQKAEELITEYPEAHVVWSVLGASADQMGNKAKAREAFEKSIQIMPGYAKGHNNLGIFLLKEGDLQGALRAFQKTALLQPNHAYSHNNLGVVLRSLGKLDEALAAFKTAVMLNSDYADAYVNMAITLKSQGKLVESTMAQKKAISLMPSYVNNQNLPMKAIDFQQVEYSELAYSALPTPRNTKLNQLVVAKDVYALEMAVDVHRLPINYRIKNAKVLGQSNIILNNKLQFSLENIVFNRKNNDKIFNTSELPFFDFKENKYYFTEEISIKHAVFIGSHWNFGHWMFNHLARLFFMDENAWKTTKLIVSASLNNSYADTLKEIGVPAKNIIKVKSCQILKVEDLLIPQMPWVSFEGSIFITRDLFPWLREKLNVNLNTTGIKNKKIFITRASAKHRRVINEKELFEIAQDFGFILTDIGSLSIKQQLLLGKETSHIISPMGANSSFFLFAQEHAKMLEMSTPGSKMNVMGAFAHASSIQYRQIIGKAVAKDSISKLDYDYVVDPLKFSKELQILMTPL